MKIEDINGNKKIILDEGETIFISTPDNEKSVEVNNTNNRINIANYLPKDKLITKSERIIEKCDELVDMFRTITSVFVELAQVPDTYVAFETTTYLDNFQDTHRLGNMISLSIKVDDESILGPVIELPSANKDIFNYIFAKIAAYYVSTFYQGEGIYENIPTTNKIYSNDMVRNKTVFTFDNCDVDSCVIMKGIVGCHNFMDKSPWLIERLKGKIVDQYVDELFDKSYKNTLEFYNKALESRSRRK